MYGQVTHTAGNSTTPFLYNGRDGVMTEENGLLYMPARYYSPELKDEAGKIRIRIDPPDKVTQYPHVHVYDNDGNLLDSLGNIVDRKSPDGHIPYKN